MVVQLEVVVLDGEGLDHSYDRFHSFVHDHHDLAERRANQIHVELLHGPLTRLRIEQGHEMVITII